MRIAAGGELVAVADHVVLESGDLEDPLLVRMDPAATEGLVFPPPIEERLCGEVDLLFVLLHSYLLEIDHQRQSELVLVAKPELVTDTHARRPVTVCPRAGREEHGVATFQSAFSRIAA